MPIFTQTQRYLLPGQPMPFGFAGLDAPAVGDVLITVRMVEMDISSGDFTENYTYILEGGALGFGAVFFDTTTGEQIVVGPDDTTFEFTFSVPEAVFNAFTADDVLLVQINPDATVNVFGPTNEVQVTMAYAEDRALVGATKLTGAEVLVFDDATYVDTAGTQLDESDTIQQSLTSLGHNVSVITTDNSNALGAALKGKDVFVIPELEVAGFAPSAAFIAELQAFTARGGTVIVAGGNTLGRNTDFMNDVFGFSTTETGSTAATPIEKVVNPATNHVTTFDDDPATLASNPQITSIVGGIGGLPTDAVVLYEDDNGDATVWGVGYGLGQVISLGWSWVEAAPLGTRDGGWLQVLDSAVSTTADEIPDNTSTTAVIVDNEPAFVHNVNTRDDVDWFALEALCDVTYTISTDDFGGAVDPYLEVRDQSGNLIAFDETGGPGDDALLTFTATYSGTYFITSGNSPISALIGNGGVSLTATSDLVRLTNGMDNAVGGGGEDKIAGLDGDDFIRGGAGDDALWGDDGNDTLRGQNDNDKLSGGADDDLIFGNAGDDSISGDDGNDALFGNVGMDTIIGGTGDDQISGNEDNDELFGGEGNDSMFGGAGNDDMFGQDGMDLMEGNDGDDSMRGGDMDDRLFGGRDNDTLRGDDGDDELNGQQGDDSVTGGEGNDRIFGIGGDDELRGDAGIDNIFGGSGDDFVDGGSENDQLFGEAGDDFIRGGSGNDKLFGGSENDQLWGDSGDDEIFGDAGNDNLFGGIGTDSLFGGAGNDTLQGGGDDAGIDRLTGGAGADTFIYTVVEERSVITDFNFAEGDAVQLFGIDPADFALWTITTVAGGSAALVDFDGDADGINEIRFDGYTAGDVLAGWFI